jgi:polar amino acid transport system substrate-binding protein
MNNSNVHNKICSDSFLCKNIWRFIACNVETRFIASAGPRSMLSMGWILLLAFLTLSCQGAGRVVPTTASVHPTIAVPSDLVMLHVLTVGSYTNYLPQEYIDPVTHQLTGFDIDLIKAIAQRLGLRVNIVNADFSTLIDRLQGKQFDLAISAMSIAPDLRKKANFVSYFRGGESLLVRKANPSHISNLEDLCGQKVAVKEGSFEQNDLVASNEKCQKDGKQLINIITRPQFSDVIQMLAEQKVVATYQDSAQTDYFVKQHADLFEVGGGVVDANLEGIAVRKEDTVMLNAISAAFHALVSDGTYHRMIMRWGLTSGEISNPDVSSS